MLAERTSSWKNSTLWLKQEQVQTNLLTTGIQFLLLSTFPVGNYKANSIQENCQKIHWSQHLSGLLVTEGRQKFDIFQKELRQYCKTSFQKSAIKKNPMNIWQHKIHAHHTSQTKPGVTSIGLGLVLLPVSGNLLLVFIENVGEAILFLGDNSQLCLDRTCGIEYAIQYTQYAFDTLDSEAIFLIDAKRHSFSELIKKTL